MLPTIISARPLENAIKEFLKQKDEPGLREFLATQLAPDIADVIDRLPEPDQIRKFKQLSPELAAATLVETDGETKRDLLKSLDRKQMTAIARLLPMDDLARVLVAAPDEIGRIFGPVSGLGSRELLENRIVMLTKEPHSRSISFVSVRINTCAGGFG